LNFEEEICGREIEQEMEEEHSFEGRRLGRKQSLQTKNQQDQHF